MKRGGTSQTDASSELRHLILGAAHCSDGWGSFLGLLKALQDISTPLPSKKPPSVTALLSFLLSASLPPTPFPPLSP